MISCRFSSSSYFRNVKKYAIVSNWNHGKLMIYSNLQRMIEIELIYPEHPIGVVRLNQSPPQRTWNNRKTEAMIRYRYKHITNYWLMGPDEGKEVGGSGGISLAIHWFIDYTKTSKSCIDCDDSFCPFRTVTTFFLWISFWFAFRFKCCTSFAKNIYHCYVDVSFNFNTTVINSSF